MGNMKTNLVHRINRIQGQLESLKKSIDADQYSQEVCLANLRLLKASINGLKKFGAAYMQESLALCLEQEPTEEEVNNAMKIAIDTGFNL